MIVRTTRGVCPSCRKEVPAVIVEKEGKAYFEKTCPEHGDCSILLSQNPGFLADLADAYYTLVPENLPVKNIEIALSSRCNLKCPICLADPLKGVAKDLTLADVENIVRSNPASEISLWGLEPTEHPDLEAMIMAVRKAGKSPTLVTNGLKLADYAYAERLCRAGLSYVDMQFDGFDERAYLKLRGQVLLKTKLRALDNLKRLGVSTCLNVVIAKGINENQIVSLIRYCTENDFIKMITFDPLMKVGGGGKFGPDMIPYLHEVLSIIERETKGKIKVDSIRIFQKLMYVAYRFTKSKKCFWLTSYVLIRDRKKSDYMALDEIIDFKNLDAVLSKYISGCKQKFGLINDLRLVARLFPFLFHRRVLPLILGVLVFSVFGKKVRNLRYGKELLWLTCNDFCDVYKMDLDMSDRYCEEIFALKSASEVVYSKGFDVIRSI